jgi:Abortive infection C-terminus
VLNEPRKRGSADAALLVGTSKDLLEAVAAHILQLRYGGYSSTSNFPTLLGQVFVALGLATPMDQVSPGEPSNKRVERAMYELACGINQLRNKQGTGHGRPWLPSVTDTEARTAIESMGVIAERLLSFHRGIK